MRNAIVFALVLAPLAAHAVVATTSPYDGGPADDAFAYVGAMSGASAVAIGPHLILTAGHVAAGDFRLGGDVFHMTSTEIAPDWKKRDVDLRLVTVAETLPGWYAIGDSARRGATVTMVGYGATGVVKADDSGYSLATSGVRHAGTNAISSKETTKGVGPTMRAILNGAGEATLAPGDSGGGWFVDGQLVGISAYTFSKKPNKPDYGWGGTDYFGSGAIDLTNGLLNDWVDAQVEEDLLQWQVQAVPEPASLLALGLGVAALLRRRRREG